MPIRLTFLCVFQLILSTTALCVIGWTEASAQDRCLVADPTGTPLNVRTAPDGHIVRTFSNGTFVTIFDRSSVQGRTRVYVGRYEDRVPIGWVYRDYLYCNATAKSQPSPYVVDGLALGDRVRFESEAYNQYHCTPSEKFPGFTWCHKEKTEKTKRGEVTSSNSILHSQDGTAVYVNRYIEPAYFGPDEVRTEINRLSAKFGERAREIWMPPREGLPRAVMAVWGKIELQQLTAADVSTIVSGGTVKGLLVSFLGDLQHSAKAGVPVYKLGGGAGFLWVAAFNQDGRGVLRFLTIDASQVEQPFVAANPTAPPPPAPAPPSSPTPTPSRTQNEESDYAKIGWWSVTHREVNSLSGCSATAQFADQTTVTLALIQGDSGKGWVLFVSNPHWDVWVTKRAQHSLWLLTTKPWHGAFNVSDDGKTLVLGDASIDFMNSLADTHFLQIFRDNKQPLTSLEMKDSDPAIKAVVNCVRERPFNRAPPEAGTTFFGTAFFVATNLLLTNSHVVKDCRGPIQARYPDKASYPATISGQDPTNDLALLHTDMPNFAIAAFHPQPHLVSQLRRTVSRMLGSYPPAATLHWGMSRR